jgi:putative transposase
MACENPTWERRRIQAELALLGYEVGELTVAKYMHRTSPRPYPTWRVFLTAHVRDIVAVDFFLVPTLTFRLLFVFVVLRHERRELLHQRHGSPYCGLDDPADDRGIPGRFGSEIPVPWSRRGLRRGVRAASQEDGNPRGPHRATRTLAEPVCRAVIGSIRRECLDHFLILSEPHLRRLLRDYVAYYNRSRPHQALANNSPIPREVQPPSDGPIRGVPKVGGIHHRYQRVA